MRKGGQMHMEEREGEGGKKNDGQNPSLFYHLQHLTFCKASIVNHVFPVHAVISIN